MPQTRELVGLADNGFRNHAGAQAAGAHGNRADFAVGELVTHILKVGVEHTLGLDGSHSCRSGAFCHKIRTAWT